MRAAVRSTRVMVLGLGAAGLVGLGSLLMPVLALGATTALVMGGTTMPLRVPPQSQDSVNGYVYGAQNRYINHPSENCHIAPGDCQLLGAVTPEEFVPVNGTLTFNQSVQDGRNRINGCLRGQSCEVTDVAPFAGTRFDTFPSANTFRVFGYSQSATIVTLVKRDLAANPPAGDPTITFDVIGNPDRPNGGFLARGPEGFTIPFLDVTFFGPTPTDTGYLTDDYSRQYDGWSDGPVSPVRPLAVLNALLGIALLHNDYFSGAVGEPVLQDVYGDTTYYLIPTDLLPLVSWMAVGPVGSFTASVLDAPLRVLVETAYDRETSPGEPTRWKIFYIPPHPLRVPINFAIAIPTGWDDAISQAAGDPDLRPFRTEPAGPYGVGGPPVTMDPLTNDQDDNLTASAVVDENDPGGAADVQPSATPQAGTDIDTTSDTPDAELPSTPDATTPTRPKTRNPFGLDRLPKLGDLAPAIKRVFAKPDKADSDDAPKDTASAVDGTGASGDKAA